MVFKVISLIVNVRTPLEILWNTLYKYFLSIFAAQVNDRFYKYILFLNYYRRIDIEVEAKELLYVTINPDTK